MEGIDKMKNQPPPPINEKYPKGLRDLVSSTLQYEECSRPPMANVVANLENILCEGHVRGKYRFRRIHPGCDVDSLESNSSIPALVHLLQVSTDAPVLAQVASCLKNVCFKQCDNIAAIVNAGAIPLLMKLLGDSKDTAVLCSVMR
eukprot:Rmarinus@m.18289